MTRKTTPQTARNFESVRDAQATYERVQHRAASLEATLTDIEQQLRELSPSAQEDLQAEALLAGDDPANGPQLAALQAQQADARKDAEITKRALGKARERLERALAEAGTEVGNQARPEHVALTADVARTLVAFVEACDAERAFRRDMAARGVPTGVLPPMDGGNVGTLAGYLRDFSSNSRRFLRQAAEYGAEFDLPADAQTVPDDPVVVTAAA